MAYQEGYFKRFTNISEWSKDLGYSFFSYYARVFAKGELSAREKTLIGLAVAHAVQCPYCIESFTTASLEQGFTETQMMEAVHVAGAIKGGATLVHGVQMMKQTDKMSKT